jgi:hypothetical protein
VALTAITTKDALEAMIAAQLDDGGEHDAVDVGRRSNGFGDDRVIELRWSTE